MRKTLTVFGFLAVAAALLFVQPASADSFVDNFQITGEGYNISFSLPAVLTPSSVQSNGTISIPNVSGVVINGNLWPAMTVTLGPTGIASSTDFFAIGDKPGVLEIVAPGLFTWNADGTVSINTGTFTLADWYVGAPYDITLTVTDPPAPVATPEPASLALLGFGGLALAAFRRSKAA